MKEVIEYMPDPEQQIWPTEEVHNFRGHHPQELVDFAYDNDVSVICIDAMPAFAHHSSTLQGQMRHYLTEEQYTKRFEKYLYGNYGVLAGVAGFNAGHAVAWDGEKVYDPRGEIYQDITIQVMSFYIFKPNLVFKG